MNMGWDGKHVVKGLWDLIIGYWQGGRKDATYMSGRGVFLNCCCMDTLFFKGLEKKLPEGPFI